MPVYAVIDLGSYTAKLTIAHVDGDISVLEKDECSTRLGQGFGRPRLLQPKAIKRTINVVKKWQAKIRKYDVVATGIFTTGVSRIALNKKQLIDSVVRDTGLTIRILSKEDEAKVLFRGVVSDFPNNFMFVILNVGGSTTRVVIGKKESIIDLHCIPIGTIRLNRLLKTDPPTDEENVALMRHIEESFRKIDPKSVNENSLLIHTGGELDYILSTGCRVEKFGLSPSHPFKVLLSDFEVFAQKTKHMKREELRSFKPDNPMWMDGAIVSNAIAIHVAHKLGFSEIIPSNRNVIDGFLLDLRKEHKSLNGG